MKIYNNYTEVVDDVLFKTVNFVFPKIIEVKNFIKKPDIIKISDFNDLNKISDHKTSEYINIFHDGYLFCDGRLIFTKTPDNYDQYTILNKFGHHKIMGTDVAMYMNRDSSDFIFSCFIKEKNKMVNDLKKFFSNEQEILFFCKNSMKVLKELETPIKETFSLLNEINKIQPIYKKKLLTEKNK